MASVSSISMPTITAAAANNGQLNRAAPTGTIMFGPSLPTMRASKGNIQRRGSMVVVKASLKEKAVTGLTAAVMTAYMVAPQAAEAAELTPSLKNFLLSIAAGGVVLAAIGGAVIGVSYFDPVKRS